MLKTSNINQNNLKFYPDYINKDIKTFNNTIGCNDIIISRNRNTGINYKFNNNVYKLDIDFCWGLYLSLFDDCNKIVVCCNHQLYQLYMVLLFEKMFNLNNKTIGIATPYINTNDNANKMLEDRVLSTKLFCLLNIKWNNKENCVNEGLINYLNSMNVEKKQQLYELIMSEKYFENLESAINIILKDDFNFQKGNNQLKKVRKK